MKGKKNKNKGENSKMGCITISGITLDGIYKRLHDNTHFKIINVANHLLSGDNINTNKQYIVCEMLTHTCPRLFICELDIFKFKLASKEYIEI